MGGGRYAPYASCYFVTSQLPVLAKPNKVYTMERDFIRSYYNKTQSPLHSITDKELEEKKKGFKSIIFLTPIPCSAYKEIIKLSKLFVRQWGENVLKSDYELATKNSRH